MAGDLIILKLFQTLFVSRISNSRSVSYDSVSFHFPLFVDRSTQLTVAYLLLDAPTVNQFTSFACNNTSSSSSSAVKFDPSNFKIVFIACEWRFPNWLYLLLCCPNMSAVYCFLCEFQCFDDFS